MTTDAKVQDEKTIKLRAAMIRKKLYERHPLGSAVREVVDSLTDLQLIAQDDAETKSKIKRLEEKSIKK
jgi:hypothetical protein